MATRAVKMSSDESQGGTGSELTKRVAGTVANTREFLHDVRVEMVMPGDNVSCEVSLITPVALEKGLRFAIREGGHTVGAGAVTEIIE